MIPLTDCEERGIYLVYSRNLLVGVFNGALGFIGIREKFGAEFLFTEYHHDSGPPFGTVRPDERLGTLPDGIELREYNPTVCSFCGGRVDFNRENSDGTGKWYHVLDESLICATGVPIASTYKPLFDYLKQIEADLPEEKKQ